MSKGLGFLQVPLKWRMCHPLPCCGNHTMSSGEVELRIRACQIRRGWNPVWPRVMLSRKLRLKALLMKKIAPSLNTLVRASWRVALVCAGLLLLTTGSSTAQTTSVIRWVAIYEENNSPDKMLRLPRTSSERRWVPLGGTAIEPSQGSRVTEAAVRGFWKGWRECMGV